MAKRNIRNNRQFWWIVDFVAFFIFIAIYVSGVLPISPGLGKGVSVLWLGLLSLHSFMVYGRSEPAKEKSKQRVSLSDDGELLDVADGDDEGSLSSVEPAAQTKNLRG
jgi:hypothetical protein